MNVNNNSYKELVQLDKKYRDQGLVILAYPDNSFGGQEPGNAKQIRDTVTSKFGVEFLMMEKVQVNGPNTDPVWKALKESGCPGCSADVEWNFRGKFLVDKQGKVVMRTGEQPSALEGKIKELLAA